MTHGKPLIGFIGAGRVATALARALNGAGYAVVAVASRSFPSSLALVRQLPYAQACDWPQDVVDESDLVFITTPDDAIRLVAESLRWRPNVAVVHTSGAASLDVLESAASSKMA